MLKVYMTEFFICSVNLHNVLITIAKQYLIAMFRPPVLMFQRREISLPVGYKRAKPITGDWE